MICREKGEVDCERGGNLKRRGLKTSERRFRKEKVKRPEGDRRRISSEREARERIERRGSVP